MKLLELRSGRTIEVTLSDDTELVGRVGKIESTPHCIAFELTVSEEFDDGSQEEGVHVINWNDVRYFRDVRDGE